MINPSGGSPTAKLTFHIKRITVANVELKDAPMIGGQFNDRRYIGACVFDRERGLLGISADQRFNVPFTWRVDPGSIVKRH